MNRTTADTKAVYEKDPYFIYLDYHPEKDSWEVRVYKGRDVRSLWTKGNLLDAKSFSEEALLREFPESRFFFHPISALERISKDDEG